MRNFRFVFFCISSVRIRETHAFQMNQKIIKYKLESINFCFYKCLFYLFYFLFSNKKLLLLLLLVMCFVFYILVLKLRIFFLLIY